MREIRKTSLSITFIFIGLVPYLFKFLGKEEKQPTQAHFPAVTFTILGIKRLLQAHSQAQVKNPWGYMITKIYK